MPNYADMLENGAICFYAHNPKFKKIPWYNLGQEECPTSALLEPYHPRDWQDSLTTRPMELGSTR